MNINLYHSWILTALLKQLPEHQRLPSICYTHYWGKMRYTLNNMDLFPLCQLYVRTEKLNCLAAAHQARRRSGTPAPQLGFSYIIYPRHYTGYTILCSRESTILHKYVNFYLFIPVFMWPVRNTRNWIAACSWKNSTPTLTADVSDAAACQKPSFSNHAIC